MIPIIFYGLIILVIIIDQLSKYIVRQALPIGDTIEIWEGVLYFTHIQNSGAAFGWFEGYGRLFVPIAVFVTVVSMYLFKKGLIHGKVMEIGLAFFVGGAIGNAIDRVLFNQVTDFIDFEHKGGILNLADYALNIGVILLFIDMLIMDNLRKRKARDSDLERTYE